MLILGNEDVEELLTMEDIISAMEPAYAAIAEERAVSGARTDVVSETAYRPEARYWLKSAVGITPDLGIGSVRINSDVVTWPVTNGKQRRVKVPLSPGDRWCGLVLLFSSATGEPLAIFPDGAIQRMRVAGSTALSIKHMSREESRTLALIGTGFQAGAHLMAACAVRPIEQVRCFSPNAQRRQEFARTMAEASGVEVIPTDTAEEAAVGADIIVAATNSLDPVIDASWVKPGMHIATIRHGEFDIATIERANTVAIHDPGNLGGALFHAPPGLTIPDLEQEAEAAGEMTGLKNAPTLAEVVAGRRGRRMRQDEITCFLNYHGLGFQFTATGAAFYKRALAEGRGHKLPTEWFTEDVHP
ncbi:MAG: hypothetical protein RLZ98_2875 [Pseudomonadota bacterium]|jgi:ornithine cyclodeaminase/alanine dehydrogenase-like protein (mu-crystallin family)